jgi:hypothetical protein
LQEADSVRSGSDDLRDPSLVVIGGRRQDRGGVLGQEGEQRREGLGEADDDVVAIRRDGLDRCLVEDAGLALRGAQGRDDGLGCHGRAIVEGHLRTQLEAPDLAVVGEFPERSECRNRLPGLVSTDERLGHAHLEEEVTRRGGICAVDLERCHDVNDIVARGGLSMADTQHETEGQDGNGAQHGVELPSAVATYNILYGIAGDSSAVQPVSGFMSGGGRRPLSGSARVAPLQE